MKKIKKTEIGVPEAKKVNNFSLATLEEAAGIVDEFSEVLLKASTNGESTYLPVTYAKISARAHLHEHALVIDLIQYTDSAACHYDDAGEATLYIFEDEIAYVVTKVDSRINDEPNVNADKKAKLDAKAGNSVEITKDMLNPKSKIGQLSLAMSKKKRELLSSKKEIVDLKKEVYLTKLGKALTKEPSVAHSNK